MTKVELMASNQHTNHGNHDPETEVQLSYYASRAKAIETLLVEKGVMTTSEIDREVNAMDSKSPADGAKIVALHLMVIFRQRLSPY